MDEKKEKAPGGERTKDNAFSSLTPRANKLSDALFSSALPRPHVHHNGDISSRGQNSVDTAQSIARASYSHFGNGSDAAAVTTDRNEIFVYCTPSGLDASLSVPISVKRDIY